MTILTGPRAPSRGAIITGALILAMAIVAVAVSRLGSTGPRSLRATTVEAQPALDMLTLKGVSDDFVELDAAFAQEAPADARQGAAWAEAPADGALIVRTGALELEVSDVPAALERARRQVVGLGGYIAGSDEVDQHERRWAVVTYRVPVARWDDALATLRGMSDRVVRETTQAQEVTAAVIDLDARTSNLRASEAALIAIMERAGRIDDVLAVQMRLQQTREEIERLVAQRDGLADRAAMATLSVTWYSPIAAVAATQQGWDLGTEIDTAAAQTVAALQGLASFAVWLAVVVLPLVVLPLFLLVHFLLVLRRRMARSDGSGGGRPAPAGETGSR